MFVRGAPAGRIAALCAVVALCACAAPRGTDTLAPAVAGRLSLQVDASPERPAHSLSAAFDLRGTAHSGELQLSTPLGITLAAAYWGPGEARLVTAQGERRFADLEALSFEALGEALPLRALPDWLRGRPWPGAPSRSSDVTQPPGFEQLGWTVDLARFDAGWLQARRSKPPVVSLRAQLDAMP
jgi:outer membrane lipoprotein LolB